MAYWTSKIGNTPAIATRKFLKTDLEDYAEVAGYYKLGQWLQELRDTLLKTSRELGEHKVTELLGLEGGLLHAVVKHKTDMRSEKFYHKVSQVARCVSRYLQCRTARLLSDVAQLWPEAKSLHQVTHVRLPSPPLLHHLLLLMARSYVILQHARELCEEAAVWLECKISTGQRTGLALALFSIVGRVRAVSLYLLQSLSFGYDKLSCLLCGLPLQSAPALPLTLHLHQSKDHELNSSQKLNGSKISEQISEETKNQKSKVVRTDYDSAARGTMLHGLPRHLHPHLLRSHNSVEPEPHDDDDDDDDDEADDHLTDAAVVAVPTPVAEETGAGATTASDEVDLGEVIERSRAPKRKNSDSKPFKNKKLKSVNLNSSRIDSFDPSLPKESKDSKKGTLLTTLIPSDEEKLTINLPTTVEVAQSSKSTKKSNKKLGKAASLKEFDFREKVCDNVSFLPTGSSSKKKAIRTDAQGMEETLLARSRAKLAKRSSAFRKSCSQLQLSLTSGHEELTSKSPAKLKKKKSFSLYK